MMCCEDKKAEVVKQEKLYKKPWFWICMTVIVFCITRPDVIVMCGNGSGNNNNGNRGKETDASN